MPASTNVNNRTVVHATSGGVCMGMPDVCKTPTPGGPVPIPYPNVAKSQDTAMGSSTVTVDGQPIMLKGSCFSQSTGDEAGSAGGVLSSIIKGKAEFINYSFDVMVEGKNVCRLGDMMLLNNRNTPPAPEVQPPLVVLPSFAVLPSESESETKDWDLTKLEYDEEGDDEGQEDGEETSGAQQVDYVETVSAVSGDEALGDDGTVLAGGRDMPSAAARNRYIVKTLDAMAQSDSESSTYFYSEGRTMGDTGPHAGSPSDPTHCDWAPKSEVPPGATPWGEGQAHPTGARYVGAEARSPIKTLEVDIRLSLQEQTTSWVRLTTGETIQIDPNARIISQIRGPLGGLPAAFSQPVPIPQDIILSTPIRRPLLGI